MTIDEEAKFISAKQILEEDFTGRGFMTEAIIVDCDVDNIQKCERKPGGSPKKRFLSSGDGSTQGLDILLLDNTGPIMGTMQNEPLETIVQLVRNALSALVKIRVEHLRVAELAHEKWNGRLLSRVRRIQSVPSASNRPRSIATLIHLPTSPFLIFSATHTLPNASACICHFAALSSSFTAPFRPTFKGIINEVSKRMSQRIMTFLLGSESSSLAFSIINALLSFSRFLNHVTILNIQC